MRSIIISGLALGSLAPLVRAQELVLLPSGFDPQCISGDGTVVGGSIRSNGLTYAAIWTRTGGVERLRSFALGFTEGIVHALNLDGTAGTGLGRSGGQIPMRWSRSEGVVFFQEIPPIGAASGYGISDDGSLIVGMGTLAGHRGFTWTPSQGLRNLPGDADGQAMCVSGDGRFFAGGIGSVGSAGLWRWSLDTYTGHVMSGDNPLTGVSAAMSRAGDVVVGQFTTDRSRGFVWTTQGFLQVDAVARFLDVTDDGRVAVGQMRTPTGAAYYTESLGAVSLAPYLTSTFGMDVSAVTMAAATGISYDGRVITGTGSPSNWVVYLPAPRPGDFNGDEEVTTDDLVAYLDCFAGEAVLPPTAADVTKDDFTDWIDFDEFLASF